MEAAIAQAGYNIAMNKNQSSSPILRQPQVDVCIVGNGAIAKTAALGLAQAGLCVTMLVPPAPVAARPRGAAKAVRAWDARVYALNHTAFDLLTRLKVWGALDAERIAPVDAMAIKGDAAQHGGELSFDAFSANVDALAWIVEDANLNQALDAALKFAPNLTVVQGTATRLQVEATHATVHLEQGDAVHASLVLGADGAQSWVRAQCEIGLDYRAYGQTAVVSNFACEHAHHGVARQWFTGDSGIIALLPLPDKQVSLVWSAPEALAAQLQRESASALAARLAHWCGHELGALQPLQPELVRAFPLSLIKPHTPVAPRVALIGDAAHVVHPLAGHGMNLGFGDIVDLLQVLEQREDSRDCGDERVLARYARARKEDVLLMQWVTDGLARLFATDFEPLRMLRNLGMNLFDKLPVLKQHLIAHALGKR